MGDGWGNPHGLKPGEGDAAIESQAGPTFIITNDEERAARFSARGCPAMTRQEVAILRKAIDKVPDDVVLAIAAIKKRLGGVIESARQLGGGGG